MIKKIFHFPFFPFFVGVFPIVALWNINKTQVYPRDVLLSIGITILFVLVIWFLCLLIFRSPGRASIASSFIFLLFFSYGHAYNLLKDKTILGTSIGFVKLFLVYAVLFIMIMVVAIKINRISPDLNLYLNVVFSILVLFNLIQIIRFETISNRNTPMAQTSNPSAISSQDTASQPDIYYIILDSYSRQDVLSNLLHYDNSSFINSLRERGFYVADCSNSNYNHTLPSVTSTLNYSFVDIKASENDEEDKNLTLELINNKVRSDLTGFGYKFVTTKGFSTADDINNSDIYLDYLQATGAKDTIAQSQFTSLYLETTILRVLYEVISSNPVKYDGLSQWLFISGSDDKSLGYDRFWYNQTRYVFDFLENLPEKDGKYFIYAHINAPHGPFVFDQNGNFRHVADPEDNAPYYLDQITYINKRVLQLVDALISKSTTPPIIIIQGDHGAHVLTTGLDKHKILNAYFVPKKMQADLYETITPINTFPLLLDDVFHKNIKLLPDTLYVKFTNDLEPVASSCANP
jgi:hypothetical protein